MVYLFSLLLLVGCLEPIARVEVVNSRGMIEQVRNGQRSFGYAFRYFVKTSDLGGLYRLLWKIEYTEVRQYDRQQIYQLLLAEQGNELAGLGNERDLARKAYPLLHNILKMAANDELRPRDSSKEIESIITGKLVGAITSLAREASKGPRPHEEESSQRLQRLQKINVQLADLETAYREFEYLYTNIGQDNYLVGRQIRRSILFGTGRIVGLLDGKVTFKITPDTDQPNFYTALSRISETFRENWQHEGLGDKVYENVESLSKSFGGFLDYVEKSAVWWNH